MIRRRDELKAIVGARLRIRHKIQMHRVRRVYSEWCGIEAIFTDRSQEACVYIELADGRGEIPRDTDGP